MILTYKVRHGGNFTRELALARKVAEYAVEHRSMSSKDVKHLGLKSAIANQVLRKYARSKTVKEVRNVKLTIPSQGVKRDGDMLRISCLKLDIPITFPSGFDKVNQVEVGSEFAYVSVTFKEPAPYAPSTVLGVDRNTTLHVLVASNLDTGKVLKLGKSCHHVHKKYRDLRRKFQRQGKLGLLKRIKHRESNLITNTNHHISKKLIATAKEQKAVVVLEDLKHIRTTAPTRSRNHRHSLNSWSFHQLASMMEYKAKKQGVSIAYVAPQYTSQRCCKCGHIDAKNRIGNKFCCLKCAAVEDSGANAGFNIATLHREGIPRFSADRDALKGSTDTPREATP